MNLTVGNNGGSLDGTLNMNIRGAGTIGDGSGSSPLVLIDGIEGDLNTVNPNDIESVSVLKDAASASIYGARASFGVILVTTKSGKSGKTNVSYSGSARFSDAIGIPDIMDSYTFAQYFNRASANKGGGDIFAPAVMERIKAYQEGTLKATTVDNGAGIWQKWANANGNTDWFEEFYDHWAPSQEHNLSINGGTDKTQYLISGSFLDQKGLMRHGSDKFQRYTLNGKITTAVTDWFKVTYSTKWTREDFERPTYLTGSFFHNLARKWPVHPLMILTDSLWTKVKWNRWKMEESRIARKIFIRISCNWFSSLLKTGKSILKVVYVPLLNISIGKYYLFMPTM